MGAPHVCKRPRVCQTMKYGVENMMFKIFVAF
jgi:hypothetical protein